MQRRHGAGSDPKGSCHSFTSCPSLPTVFLPACLPAFRDCCASRTAISATLHYNERPGKKHNSLLAVNTVRWTEPESAIVRSTDSIPVGCKRSPISAGGWQPPTIEDGQVPVSSPPQGPPFTLISSSLGGTNSHGWTPYQFAPGPFLSFSVVSQQKWEGQAKPRLRQDFFVLFFVCLSFRVVPRPPSCRMF